MFGISEPIELCQIGLTGAHPVLNLEPMVLDWGETVVLIPSTKHFTIINTSPVSTDYSLNIVSNKFYNYS